MGRGHRSIFFGDSLGRAVVEVGEVEALVGRAHLHLLEGVGEVGEAHLVEPHGGGVVGVDRDERHAACAVVGDQLLEPLLVRLGRRAVVAGEYHHEHLGGGEVGERILLAVDPRQPEIRGRCTEGKRGVVGGAKGGREQRGRDKQGGKQRGAHGEGIGRRPCTPQTKCRHRYAVTCAFDAHDPANATRPAKSNPSARPRAPQNLRPNKSTTVDLFGRDPETGVACDQ